MSYRAYPNPRRALRHIVRTRRVSRQTWRNGAASRVEVHVYPGTMSEGVEAEVRRMLSRERRHRTVG